VCVCGLVFCCCCSAFPGETLEEKKTKQTPNKTEKPQQVQSGQGHLQEETFLGSIFTPPVAMLNTPRVDVDLLAP